MGREVRRQAGQLAALAEAQAYAEELAAAPLTETEAAALAVLAEEHDTRITLERRQLELAAEQLDAAPGLIMQERDAEEAAARGETLAPVAERPRR